MKQKNVLLPPLFIKQGNPETNFFLFNFTFLSFLYLDYDFQKWCGILINFISGSPKWGITDGVRSELILRTAVAITPAHPAHCGLSFSCSCHRTKWKTRKLECEISWCDRLLQLSPKCLSWIPAQLLRFFKEGKEVELWESQFLREVKAS